MGEKTKSTQKKAKQCKYTSIGGQALLEGVMMRGPKLTAMAVRNNRGKIVIEQFKTGGTQRGKFAKLPLVRGIFALVDSLSVGYKCLMRSADLSGLTEEEEAEKAKRKKPSKFMESLENLLEKFMGPIAMVLAVILGIGLFMYLPVQLYSWLAKAVPAISESYLLRSLFEGIVRIAIFVGYIAATAAMKDIRRTYQYHGAEHKTIFCYEKKLPLTVENVRKQIRFHPRCGTSFLVLMLLVGVVISLFIRTTNPVLRTLFKLLTFPVLIGIGYEIIRFAGSHDNLFVRIVSAPGLWIQRLTTKEPDDSMIACAIAAMLRVIPETEEAQNAARKTDAAKTPDENAPDENAPEQQTETPAACSADAPNAQTPVSE